MYAFYIHRDKFGVSEALPADYAGAVCRLLGLKYNPDFHEALDFAPKKLLHSRKTFFRKEYYTDSCVDSKVLAACKEFTALFQRLTIKNSCVAFEINMEANPATQIFFVGKSICHGGLIVVIDSNLQVPKQNCLGFPPKAATSSSSSLISTSLFYTLPFGVFSTGLKTASGIVCENHSSQSTATSMISESLVVNRRDDKSKGLSRSNSRTDFFSRFSFFGPDKRV